MHPEVATEKHTKGQFISVVKWALFIFFILLVMTVSLGLSPLGVVELNNAFFSLFIRDAREVSEVPNVSVSLEGGVPMHVVENRSEEALSSNVSAPKTGGLDVSNQHFPVRIIIPKINLDARILNPETTNLTVLNDALLYGAVRYVESGTLDSDKNILLFGHSSNLPVVHNQNFKVFLGIKTLVAGDEVILQSKGMGYRYRVESVRLTNAETEVITFSNDHKLILSTCNTLGAKEARYIAEASFVGSYSITN